MEHRIGIAVGIAVATGLIVGALWWRVWELAPALPAEPDLSTMDVKVAELIRSRHAALGAAPHDDERLFELCLVYEANGMNTYATACYRMLTTRRPRDRDGWYRLARANESAGDLASAIDAMTRAVAIDPDFAEASALLGWWLVDAGRFDEAQTALDRAPESETAMLGRVLLHLEQREAAKAVALIEKHALLERPNGPYAWRLLADAHRQRGQTAEAAAALARAGQGRPVWPDVHADRMDPLRIGRLHRQAHAKRLRAEGDLDGALRVLLELRRDRPDDVQVLETLAACYLEMKRVRECFDAIDEALRLQPGAYGTNLVAANAWLAVGHAQPDALEHALRHAEIAADARPAVADPHLARARALIALDRREEAIEVLVHAADLDGRDASALNQAGLLAWELGRNRQALQSFRLAQTRDPQSATPLAGLAIVMATLGQGTEAEALLREAMRLRQDHPELMALARQKLAELQEGDD